MTLRAFVSSFVLSMLLGVLLLGALKLLPSADATMALAWWETKEERLSTLSDNEPRIIFVGGSATLFGLDAEQLEVESGSVAFNFGLHASFGQEVLFDAPLRLARPGDVLVWTPELDTIAGAFPSLALYGRPDARMDPAQLITHWLNTPINLRARLTGPQGADSPYHPSALGLRGDQRRNLGQRGAPLCVGGRDQPIDWALIERQISRSKAAGVRLVVRAPSVAEVTCNDWVPDRLAVLERGLSARGTMMLNARSPLTPPEHFYDTAYHLNRAGAKVATEALAMQLRQAGILEVRDVLPAIAGGF